MFKRYLITGALVVGTAVVLGAIGSHALESYLESREMVEGESDLGDSQVSATNTKLLDNWETAVRYQVYHGFAMILLGTIARFHNDRWMTCAIAFFLAGVVLFSGMLYVWVLTETRFFVMLVPIGGFSLIAGWVCSFCSFWRIKSNPEVGGN